MESHPCARNAQGWGRPQGYPDQRGSKAVDYGDSEAQKRRVKRSIWETVSLVLLGVWSLVLLGLAAYSLALSVRYPAFTRDNISLALFSALFGSFGAIGWYGLWRRKRWGWWLASICSWGLAVRFVYIFIHFVNTDGWAIVDWAFAVSTAYSLALPIWLVMPGTRKAYWNKTNL